MPLLSVHLVASWSLKRKYGESFSQSWGYLLCVLWSGETTLIRLCIYDFGNFSDCERWNGSVEVLGLGLRSNHDQKRCKDIGEPSVTIEYGLTNAILSLGTFQR